MSLEIEATEARNLIDIEAGIYAATVTGVEPAEGTFGEQIKFSFSVDGQTTEDGDPLELWGWASQKLNPKSKLWKWAKVLTGQEPVKGTVFDVEDLVGKRCSLLVIREETDEGVRCKVKDVLAPKKAAAPTSDTCSECLDPVSYFTPEGGAFCDDHGPRAAK